ncbi:MAG: cytochrome c-type biogenesis protein CcmH [Gammaproteobacteria bacterium]|nr:cytochrome c-type biogenesis protein CcmH [Gammaproteobacteria bacterium]MDD9894510.1 cytochrome c-type biogenesis protein CcmH [Gammaproteobacteria bacterium]MDD9958195.1 cytochrome c-type biogenesis protein CcmH [Gammaproteobacteria bacterium]
MSASLKLSLCVIATILFASPVGSALAQVDTFEFENEVQQQRFRTLSDELRCPMCQNTNLSGSTGGVAEDLRREVHRMILEGMSDREIEQFMFERYGDFIFYRPRLRAQTLLLWFGPIIFLLIGGFAAWGIFRRAREVEETEVALDESQKARLNELVGGD